MSLEEEDSHVFTSLLPSHDLGDGEACASAQFQGLPKPFELFTSCIFVLLLFCFVLSRHRLCVFKAQFLSLVWSSASDKAEGLANTRDLSVYLLCVGLYLCLCCLAVWFQVCFGVIFIM